MRKKQELSVCEDYVILKNGTIVLQGGVDLHFT